MNYTVLVVDDEAEQRSALISRVDWSAAGFEVIGEAENGVEALDLIDALEPDLILTDIRMPMISGLELAAKVYEMRPATQIVILSGYDSFDYARTAINYNIISYLLKPISSSELSEELFEIRRRMEVRFTPELRCEVASLLTEMHGLYSRGKTPKVRPTKKCNGCSLKELCLPRLMKTKPVSDYLKAAMEETP